MPQKIRCTWTDSNPNMSKTPTNPPEADLQKTSELPRLRLLRSEILTSERDVHVYKYNIVIWQLN